MSSGQGTLESEGDHYESLIEVCYVLPWAGWTGTLTVASYALNENVAVLLIAVASCFAMLGYLVAQVWRRCSVKVAVGEEVKRTRTEIEALATVKQRNAFAIVLTVAQVGLWASSFLASFWGMYVEYTHENLPSRTSSDHTVKALRMKQLD